MRIKPFVLSVLVASTALLSYSHADTPKKSKLNLIDKTPCRVNFFQGNYDDFLREAKKQNKPVLLDFWATWCNPCKKMDAETFTDENFSQYLNANFLTFKVNIDTFDGMEIADRFAVDAFPTLVMLDAKGKYINRLRGFFPPAYLMNELQKNKDSKGKRFVMPKEKIVSQ